jgi:endo-1,4-beta-xylanase
MGMFNRRSALLGLGSTLVAGCAARRGSPEPTPPSVASTPSLARLAADKGIKFGSTVGAGPANSGSFRNLDYVRLLKADCAIIVPENEMKWQAIRPSAETFDFGRFDEMLSFAGASGLETRGHTLLWHRPEWMPAWLEAYDFGTRPATAAADILTRHVNTVAERYRGSMSSFDVVNEAVLHDSSLATTALSRAFGDTLGLLDLAFHSARKALPDAELVYNDYMSWEPGNEGHRAGVLRLLEGFKARGVPVDTLGIQSHIRIDSLDGQTGVPARNEREWRQFLDAVTAMGYGIAITEFDVNDQVAPAGITARDQMVADFAKAYLDIMFAYPQLKTALLWGMQDQHSWLQSFKPLRADGLKKRPCPYDDNGKAKPLYAAIAAALRGAPKR